MVEPGDEIDEKTLIYLTNSLFTIIPLRTIEAAVRWSFMEREPCVGLREVALKPSLNGNTAEL